MVAVGVGWLVGCLEGYLGAVQELLTISRWWPSARSEGSTRIWCWGEKKGKKGKKGRGKETTEAESGVLVVVLWVLLWCFCGASVVLLWLQCSTMANEASQAKDTTRPRTQRCMFPQAQHNCSMALVLQLQALRVDMFVV